MKFEARIPSSLRYIIAVFPVILSVVASLQNFLLCFFMKEGSMLCQEFLEFLGRQP